MNGVLIVFLILGIIECIKEKTNKPIPLENWANEELEYQDIMNGVPMKQVIKNARDGKYRLDKK